jgi:hypothetical protein
MRYTTTFILALAVLAAASLIYVYRGQLTGEAVPPEKGAKPTPLLPNVKVDEITAATVRQRATDGEMKTRLAFKREDNQWQMTVPAEGAADAYEVDRLIRSAVEGKVGQTLKPGAQGKSSLETYGLDPAAWQLELATAAKGDLPARTITVSIGKRALGNTLYVRVDDAPRVTVLAQGELLDQAQKDVADYRNRELLAVRRGEISRIEVAGKKGLVRLDRAADNRTRWVLAEPASRADTDAAALLARALENLEIKTFVEDNPKDLTRYGLKTPALTVTVWKQPPSPEKSPEAPAARAEPVKLATFRFGSAADLKNETVYLLTDDGRHVVTVPATVLLQLDKGPRDLRDRHVVVLDPMRVRAATLRMAPKLLDKGAEGPVRLARTEGVWQVLPPEAAPAKAGAAATRKADLPTVENLLREVADLRVIAFEEGEFADVAKAFVPQGSVSLTVEGEAAPVEFEISGGGNEPALVRNPREGWVGRINETTLPFLRKGWLDFLDRQMLAVDAKQVEGLTLQTPDRTLTFEKTDSQWHLAAPATGELEPEFVANLLQQVRTLTAQKVVAATQDFEPFGLKTGQVVLTVKLAAKAGEPKEHTLRLARGQENKVLARVDAGDLMFETSPAVLAILTGEPVERRMTSLMAQDIRRLDVTAGGETISVMQVDNRWFRVAASGSPAEEAPADAVRDLVTTLADLSAARWVSYDAKDPAAYDLDKPALQVKAATDKTTVTILLSEKKVAEDVAALLDQAPLRYAMVEGGTRIAVLAGRQAELLQGAARSLAPKKEEPKPAEAKPPEAKPEEAKPAEAKPEEAKPAEAKPPEAKTLEIRPDGVKPL